ncbi:MAG: hypothetical protein KAT70_07810, partial [Thermoplasmata archaeon]|nr:hypothetical protein [Thermoplasmata archaeon]
LAVGASVPVNVNWLTTAGEHTITVHVNPGLILESTTDDNSIASKIIVYRDSPFDLVVENNEVVYINSNYNHNGYVLIKDNGVLNIINADLNVLQSYDEQFNIIVRNNGAINFLDGASLSSTHLLQIQLEDNAALTAEGGEFGANIHVFVYKTGSTVRVSLKDMEMHGTFESGSGADTDLRAVNTTFDAPITSFGGDSQGVFDNCIVSYFILQDTANVTIRVWVEVYVRDINGEPIPGAIVQPRSYLNPLVVVDAISIATDANGRSLMALRSDELVPAIGGAESTYVGNYHINVTFTDTDGGTHYAQTPIDPPLPKYKDSVAGPIPFVRTVSFRLEKVMPDLDPPLTVDNASIARYNSTVIRTEITNTGISPASNVLVRFTDTTTGEVIYENLTAYIGIDETVWINYTHQFTSNIFSNHTIEVEVNPTTNNPYYLNESDPGNNLNTTIVEVFPLADLEPVEAVLKSGDTTITIPHEGQFFS